jgi:hypothetical protein
LIFVNFRAAALLSIFTLLTLAAFAQRKWATVSGTVFDEQDRRLANVSVVILGQQNGIVSNDSGRFNLRVPANRAFALVFTFTGYKATQQNFLLNEGEAENITVRMEPGNTTLTEVVVQDARERTEAGLIRPNPKNVINLPSPVTGVESLIKVIVGSNNELTSQYNVRGGSYDENLIYVNDFEIFRPYLVRSGQQEGLSFINPALVRNINFYNGGFQARYGDKMSSVLDIQYNKPRAFSGSAYVGLLEQGVHVEGSGAKNRFTYLIGLRNRSNRNLLQRQETQGAYTPSSSDLQALLTWQIAPKWSTELLANYSQTKFTLIPSSASLRRRYSHRSLHKTSASIFSSKAVSAINIIRACWDFPPLTSRGKTCASNSSPRVSRMKNGKSVTSAVPIFSVTATSIPTALRSGLSSTRSGPASARTLPATGSTSSTTISLIKEVLKKGAHSLQWGLGYERTQIDDRLREWEYQDSAGYSLPYVPGALSLNASRRGQALLEVNRATGYLQDNLLFRRAGATYTLQAGIRSNYNDLNGEFLLSPRVGASWKPAWKKDVVFRLSAGAYHQPPFYRELRRFDGSLNTALKAQRSWQGVAGLDYNFVGLGRPLRLTVEGYYKYMTNVVPYDIDNVRVRYFGENSAKAYAMGLEARLFGELVKDAESWLSVGLLRTRENLEGDFFKNYTLDSLKRPIDSVTVEGGWLRRPTDRLLSVGLFFQDYLATNKNFRVYLNTIYGTNLPYNIPGSVKYRNALSIPAYIRVDIGFSARLLDDDKEKRRSHSPFRNFDGIWATMEVFNLIDRPNTISYLLVKDFANNTYTMPNRLTPRLLNFKIVVRW